MATLPEIYPKDLVKVLLKQGFVITRQKGSHLRLKHTDGRNTNLRCSAKHLRSSA